MTYLKWLKQQGKALLIKGPEGCGKTLLASQLAGDHCPVIPVDDLTRNAKFQNWADENNGVVIVEGFPAHKDLGVAKLLIVSDKMLCNRLGKNPKKVDTPMFIFCTSDPDPLNMRAKSRRFHVIEMDTLRAK